jgi:hypothetical protein
MQFNVPVSLLKTLSGAKCFHGSLGEWDVLCSGKGSARTSYLKSHMFLDGGTRGRLSRSSLRRLWPVKRSLFLSITGRRLRPDPQAPVDPIGSRRLDERRLGNQGLSRRTVSNYVEK